MARHGGLFRGGLAALSAVFGIHAHPALPGPKGLLKANVDSVALSVAPRPLPPYWNAANPEMILSPLPAGGAYVAWNGADSALHVTTLSAQNTAQGSDFVYPKTTLGGFTQTPGGFGYTAVWDSTLSVVSVTTAGSQLFRTLLIGNQPRTDSGAKFDPMFFGSSRLLFAGGHFCSYFAHQQNWGSIGIHQGDMLVFLDTAGNKQTGGWSWGTSHSLDQRLLYDGQAFVTASIGDAYPMGLTFQRVGVMANKVTVDSVWGNEMGMANALFGNLVFLHTGLYALAFGSPQGRPQWDAGVLFLNAQGKVLDTVWLTAFPAASKRNVTQVNAAKFNNDLFVGWALHDSTTKQDSTFISVIDSTGNFMLGPDYLTEGFERGDDFINYPNGDVGWAYTRGSKMRVVRIPLVSALALEPGSLRKPGMASMESAPTTDILGRRWTGARRPVPEALRVAYPP